MGVDIRGMPKISSVHAREILDSRGNPTVEVDIKLDDGSTGRAQVPSGASTGSHEALELRDQQPERYGGKGVLRAVTNVEAEIAKAIVGKGFEQKSLDELLMKLDGTPNKARLGANAVLGVSLAFSHASAAHHAQPLYRYFQTLLGTDRPLKMPVPLINIINGGAHAENSTDIQEFMIVPLGAPTYREALRWGAEVFHALKKILHTRGMSTNVGDEGGYAPVFSSNQTAIEALLEAIEQASFAPGKDIALAIDAAANEFYHDGHYELRSEFKRLTAVQMVDLYQEWSHRYPLLSIEDGLMEDDWDGFKHLTATLGDKAQIVGDDLFVTSMKRLKYGIEQNAANSILIKLNQIGTVTETIDVIREAQRAGYSCIISNRSGETEDTSIADLAVGTGAGQIKTGSTCRGERIVKYNQLLRIEEELGDQAVYAGAEAFQR